VNDELGTFRIMYRVDVDAVVILDVFMKKTQQAPQSVTADCKRRLREYDRLGKAEEKP
jgi:phage-related protein